MVPAPVDGMRSETSIEGAHDERQQRVRPVRESTAATATTRVHRPRRNSTHVAGTTRHGGLCAYAASEYYYDAYYPSPQGWKLGDRETTCVVTSYASDTVGTLQGSGR